MMRTCSKFVIGFFLIGILFIFNLNCSNIEKSPDPGILRITLSSDPADTTIVIVTDTFVVGDNDYLGVIIFQGKVYRDSAFAVLYPTIKSYQQEDKTYNLIARENGEYVPYVIFESYVPPQDYTHIEFGIKATVLQMGTFDEIRVESPPNASEFIKLQKNFTVYENRITEIKVQLKPFQSIFRYRDTYRFVPEIEIVGVKNY